MIIRNKFKPRLHISNLSIALFSGAATSQSCNAPPKPPISFLQIATTTESCYNTSLITKFCRENNLNDALWVLQKMDKLTTKPDAHAYACLLQGSITSNRPSVGKIVHAHMIQTAFPVHSDPSLATRLVVMYSKVGDLESAIQVFDEMPDKSSISWTSIVTGYSQSCDGEEAFRWFRDMQRAGIKQDEYTFGSMLRACARSGLVGVGKQVHQCLIKLGLGDNLFVAGALLDTYVKGFMMRDADKVFKRIPLRDVVCWTTMIAGYATNGQGRECLSLFGQFLKEHMKPSHFTFSSVLMGCSSLQELKLGTQIHGYLQKSGLLGNVVISNCLVDMYCNCRRVADAQKVFENLGYKTRISWSSLVAGYATQGYGEKALQIFCKMKRSNMMPDEYTFGSVLKACAQLADISQGKLVHASLIKHGLESIDILGCALIDMYAKCGTLDQASKVFHKVSSYSLVSGNAMISANVQHGQGEEALQVFLRMQDAQKKSDAYTFISTLQACSSIAECELGKQIHAQITRSGFGCFTTISICLMDMYAKAGGIEEARQIFEEMPERDLFSWTTIISGYGKNGHGKEAISLFEKMQQSGIKVDHVSMLAVLSACSHAGLVEEGWHYFNFMKAKGLVPKVEHYGCMIDLMGRAGHLKEAYDFILQIPDAPSSSMWGSLLAACLYHADAAIGKLVANKLFCLDSQNAGYYVSLSNLLSTAGKWEEAEEVRKMMKDKGIAKQPGRSWLVVNNTVHEFCVRESSHPQIKEVYKAWKILASQLKEVGYEPDLHSDMHDVEPEEKEDVLFHHSEKLAVVFGLINLPQHSTLRVVKNLRICKDCHTAAKFISSVANKTVIIRDATRFHHFRNGACSCGNYW